MCEAWFYRQCLAPFRSVGNGMPAPAISVLMMSSTDRASFACEWSCGIFKLPS